MGRQMMDEYGWVDDRQMTGDGNDGQMMDGWTKDRLTLQLP